MLCHIIDGITVSTCRKSLQYAGLETVLKLCGYTCFVKRLSERFWSNLDLMVGIIELKNRALLDNKVFNHLHYQLCPLPK